MFLFLCPESYPDDKNINRCILLSHPVKFFVKKMHALILVNRSKPFFLQNRRARGSGIFQPDGSHQRGEGRDWASRPEGMQY